MYLNMRLKAKFSLIQARYYNPSTGTFISEDPIGFRSRDFNLMKYAFNRPTDVTDAFGEDGGATFIAVVVTACVAKAIQVIANSKSKETNAGLCEIKGKEKGKKDGLTEEEEKKIIQECKERVYQQNIWDNLEDIYNSDPPLTSRKSHGRK